LDRSGLRRAAESRPAIGCSGGIYRCPNVPTRPSMGSLWPRHEQGGLVIARSMASVIPACNVPTRPSMGSLWPRHEQGGLVMARSMASVIPACRAAFSVQARQDQVQIGPCLGMVMDYKLYTTKFKDRIGLGSSPILIHF
jgi:hypothetical protein